MVFLEVFQIFIQVFNDDPFIQSYGSKGFYDDLTINLKNLVALPDERLVRVEDVTLIGKLVEDIEDTRFRTKLDSLRIQVFLQSCQQ